MCLQMLNYQILNGAKYALFCAYISELMLATKQNAAFLWKESIGSCAPGRNGGFYLMHMGHGIASTSDLPAGAIMVCGKICTSILLMTQTWKTSCWTARSSGHIPALLVRQKKRWTGGASLRTQSGRLFHQNSCKCGWFGQSAPLCVDGRRAT